LPLFLQLLRSETAGDVVRMRRALAGLKAYQDAPRPPRPPEMPIVAQVGRATIRSYGGSGRPVLFVPSLINGSEILDLTVRNSMMRGLAAKGLCPLLLDWGLPAASDRDLGIGGHVERFLVPAMDAIGGDAVLAGYCLGGTMSLAAAAFRPPRALILIATPWDFSGFPSHTRNELPQLWDALEPVAGSLGLMPAEALQQIFWHIDASRTIAKFENFAGKDSASPEGQNYVAVEDWANEGPPLSLAAGRELLVDFLGSNVTAEGRWRVGGRVVDPGSLMMPCLNVVSTIDRITPAQTAWRGGEHIRLVEGHVGMVVGRRAPESLWKSLVEWVSLLDKT